MSKSYKLKHDDDFSLKISGAVVYLSKKRFYRLVRFLKELRGKDLV